MFARYKSPPSSSNTIRRYTGNRNPTSIHPMNTKLFHTNNLTVEVNKSAASTVVGDTTGTHKCIGTVLYQQPGASPARRKCLKRSDDFPVKPDETNPSLADTHSEGIAFPIYIQPLICVIINIVIFAQEKAAENAKPKASRQQAAGSWQASCQQRTSAVRRDCEVLVPAGCCWLQPMRVE